jgi:hypothetical protein
VDRLVEVLVSLGAPSNSSSRRAENDASERAAEGEGGGPERANFKSPAIVVVYGITVRRVTALDRRGSERQGFSHDRHCRLNGSGGPPCAK